MPADSVAAPSATTGQPCRRPLLAVGAVLLGSFVVGFDTRLVSTGLPDLRGAFGLSFDEGAWLSTIATAPQILLAPAIPWLTTVFGVRRILVVPSLIFTAIAAIMPFVHDIPLLFVLHFVHGLLLGVFIPATVMIILRNLPIGWWVPGLAIYVFRQPFAANAGVPLVGYYVEHAGWHWLYWQDGIAAALMGLLAWLSTPRERVDHDVLARADWGGMLLLGTGAAMIYTGLDQGNRLDWFESGLVTSLLAGGGALVIAFLVNEALVREPWAHPGMVLTRNLYLGLLAIVAYTLTSVSNTLIVPNFLTAVRGLRPEQIGQLLFTYAALPLCAVMVVAVYLVRRYDARLILLLGLVSFAVASWMGAAITSDWAPDNFIPLVLLQSLAQGVTFMAIVIFALSNANPARAPAISAYFQLLRLGGAEIAGSLVTTWLRVREQIHSNLIGLHLPAGGDHVTHALSHLENMFSSHSGATETATARSLGVLAALVQREATVLATIDGFELCFWAAIAGMVLVVLMRPAPPGPLTPAA